MTKAAFDISALFTDEIMNWALKTQHKIHSGSGYVSKSKSDMQVVQALSGQDITPGDDPATRSDVVQKWLRAYSVLRGIGTVSQEAIAQSVIEFSDDRGAGLAKASVSERYRTLNKHLHGLNIRTNKNSPSQRSLLSLTSKALWAIYPDDIPIYDGYLQKSVATLSKINHPKITIKKRMPRELDPVKKDTENYQLFIDNFQRLYVPAQPKIKKFLKGKSYDYPIRIFDKVLWGWGTTDYVLFDDNHT